MTALLCLAVQACAVSDSPDNSSLNITIGSNESNVSIGASEPVIAIVSSESDKTNVSSESNVSMGAGEPVIAIGSSESDKTNVSSESNVSMGASESVIAIGSSESDKTNVSSESNVSMRSGRDYLNPNEISRRDYPNFPWYSTSGFFYDQGVPYTTFSSFTEYYVTSGMPVVGGIISAPARFDIAQRTPSWIYYGTGQALPYNQYVSTVSSGTNELWVQGASDWSQYVVSPLGTWLQLVANAPVGGLAGFYDIVQTDITTSKYSTYLFNQGYNTMNFKADQVGRHMLYFVVNNQPSNVVVVDVFTKA